MAQAAIRGDERGLLFPDVEELPAELTLVLAIRDAELVAELCNYPEGDCRDEFALAALRIGALALRQARGRIDGDMIHRETDRMLHSLEGHLKLHAAQVQRDVGDALKQYFDPGSGRFQERIERLIRKDGELEQVIRRQVGIQDSELCKTLAMHCGQESPLFKMLSPQESTGVLAAMRATLEQQLKDERERVLREFSLDNKDGALSRLVGQLGENQGKLTEEIDEKIGSLVKQFSLDNEESALSRMKVMLGETKNAIQTHLTLDDEASALSRLKRELLTILESQQKQSQSFQEEVKITLGKLVTRREEAARSTTHGREFEDAVLEFVTCESQKCGDLATATGTTVGLIKACKKGDCVIELGPDCIVPGGRIVVEAKEERDYTLANARAEIEKARENRGAEIGLFIFSKKTALATLDPFIRLGNDVFVVWDPEDSRSDLYLKAGLMLAKALCVRIGRRNETQAADFEAIDRAVLELQKQSESLGGIETSANTIKNASESILSRIQITRKSVGKQIDILQEKTRELRQALEAGESP